MGKTKKGKAKSQSKKPVKVAKRPPIVKRADDKRLGNQFWLWRSKHGTNKLFASPDLLWEAACEYFQLVKDNPFEEQIVHQGKIALETIKKIKPFTLKGLCLYLGCCDSYFRSFKSTIKPENDNGFLTVISQIESVIFNQQYEAASAGFLKENIVSRMLGLKDSQDVTTNNKDLPSAAPAINVYNTAPPLSGSERDVDTNKK